MEKVLAIIPARSGSKGIPQKNIVDLCGKPLIYYTIIESLKVKRFNRIFVSTDSVEIKDISEEYGVSVPFLRPAEISQDKSLSIDVVLNVLDELSQRYNESYDYVCLLQPTSPLRTSTDIENCLNLILNSDCDSVVSLSLVDEPHPFKMKLIENGCVVPFIPNSDSSVPRQQLPKVYMLNGAIYLSTVSSIKQNKSFFGLKTIPYLMENEKSANINSQFDLELCRLIIGQKL